MLDLMSFLIAALGAFLGIINTWKLMDKDKLKVSVIPVTAIALDKSFDEIDFGFQITNLSSFPVTINEVGVLYKASKSRGAATNPIMNDGGSFPRRMEPRTSFTAYIKSRQSNIVKHGMVKCAYVKTACGNMIKGKSPALKYLNS